MTCQEFNDLIVDYIEEILAMEKIKEFEGHLEQCSKCQITLNYYMAVVEGLHDLPTEECPESVVEKIFDSAPVKSEEPSLLANIYQTITEKFTWQMRFAAAAVFVILSVLLLYPNDINKDFVQQTYTIQEVEKFTKDIRLALVYLAYCYEKTENIIEKKVVPNYLIKPIKSSLESAIKEIINEG